MSLSPQLLNGDPSGRALEQTQDLRRTLDMALRTMGTQGAGSIGSGHIAPLSITTGSIVAGTITTELLSAGAVIAEKIQAGAITTEKLAANSITAEKIAAGTITATQIAAGTITGGLIQAGTITATNIAAATLTGSLVAAGTITGDRLVTDTITATQIVGTTLSGIFADLGTVTAGTLRIGTIGGNKVAVGDSISTSVGTKQGLVGTDSANVITFWLDSATGNLELKGTIKSGSTGLGNIEGAIHGTTNITSGTVAGDRLVANSITAGQVDAGSIRSVVLVANSITAGMVQAGQIETAKLAAGAVTADKITLSLGGSNRLLNSNFNDGVAGRSTSVTAWGVAGCTASTVLTNPDYESGKAFYGQNPTTPGGDPFVVTPYVSCSGWAKVSVSIRMSTNVSRLRRISVQFFSSSFTFLGEALTTETASGWRRSKHENVAVPGGSVYVRFYGQVASAQVGDELYWAAAQIEEGEKATAWSLAPEDILPGSVGTTMITPGAITTGLLSADAIDGKTITGALIRTATSGARVEISGVAPIGLKKYDAAGNIAVRVGQTDGLDLLVGDTNTPPTDRRLRFLRSNGVSAAEILSGVPADGSTQTRLVTRKAASTDKVATWIATLGTGEQAEAYLDCQSLTATPVVRVGAGAATAAILDGNGASSYQFSASDARDKHSIAPLDTGALGRVLALRPVEYNWKDGKGPVGRQAGLIAQEVAEVVPHAVQALRTDDGGEDRYTIQHAPLIAALIGAVQELDAAVGNLRERIPT